MISLENYTHIQMLQTIKKKFYGRAQTRSLRPQHKNIFKEMLPQFDIAQLDWSTSSKVILDIGFGMGDSFVFHVKNNPNAIVIGCEPFINGVSSAIRKLSDKSIENIYIYHGIIDDLLEQIPSAAIDQISILFPDPWPKKRHHKRRLIQADFLKALATKMKTDSTLIIASDHEDYKEAILSAILECGAFEIDEIAGKPDNWPVTKYENKAMAEGRLPVYWVMRRSPS